MICKTVGSASVGSNPTPATTCENGLLAAETRPGGPFLLVTAYIRVCHRGSMHSSGCVHMVYSVRANGAVRITARFPNLRPVCPVNLREGFRKIRQAAMPSLVPGDGPSDTPTSTGRVSRCVSCGGPGLEPLAAHVGLVVGDEPGQRLAQRLQRAVPGRVAEHLTGPADARGDAAVGVLPGGPGGPGPARRSNSAQSTRSSTGSRPNHRATPAARPRSVIACPATTWKLAPIAAGRDSASSKACATSSACTLSSVMIMTDDRPSGGPPPPGGRRLIRRP